MNEYCINALYSGFQGDTLAHHGILGMHWGIRRFQPYGQGYDADHEGREVGLAARLGGSGGSFSSTYGRGRSLGSKVKSAASFFGRRAKSAAREAAERASYGAKKAGKNIGRGISRGLDIINEQSDRLGAMLKKKTDPYIAQGKEFAKSFSSKARIRMSDVSDKAMDAGYRLVTSNGFSSAFNATLGRSSAIKKGMANLGAIAALRSGITTADKRRRSEGPTSSLGGKSFKWDTMTDKSRVLTTDERRLYGATEFEKFRDRQAGALGRTIMRGDLASRLASWGPQAQYAQINDWFETFSASPQLSRALGIDKSRADAMARGVMLSPMSSLSGPSHSERMKSLAEGRRMVESPDFISSGNYQDAFDYKFLTRSQEAKYPRM